MNLLLDKGRIAFVIRPHLRKLLSAQPNKNKYVNDLLEKEYKSKPEGQ